MNQAPLIAAVGFLMVVSSSAAVPCAAQPSFQIGANPFACPASKKNTDNPELKADRLKEPVDLADLPRYSGKKVAFVVGTAFPHVKGGASVTMEFSTADEPKKVLDWYRDVFQQHQWQPLDNMAGASGVAATKAHNICQVMTLPPSKPGAKCDFLVRYKFYRDDSAPN